MDEDEDDDLPSLHGDEEDGPMPELKEGEVQEGYRSVEQLENYLEHHKKYVRKDGRCVDDNRYAKLYKTSYDAHHYSCHSYLGDGPSPDSIVISAIYTQDHEWPFEEQNMYFEYILSDESPWRELIPNLDLNVVRLEDGTIGWLQVRSLRVNRWMLFHFLKGFRQVWERRRGMKLFTDAVKQGKSGEELYKIFLSSHLFSGTPQLQFEWGGDHKCFRGLPSESLLKKTIKTLETDVFENTYKSDKRYFGQDLISKTFGYGMREYYAQTLAGRLKDMIEGEVVYGHFLQKPSAQFTNMFNYDDVSKNLGKIADFVVSKEARKEFK